VVPAELYQRFLDRFFGQRPEPAEIAGTTDRDGAVSFVGIAPGIVYVVAASTGRMGLAGPLQLTAGEHTEAEDVGLSGTASVTFVITGDRTWLPPNSRLLIVGTPAMSELPFRFTDGVALSVMLEEAEGGEYTLRIPGRWRFELRTAAAVLLDRQEIEVPPESTTVVWLSSDRLRFRGRVFLADEPLTGTLYVSREGPQAATAAYATTDADGRFTVGLPESGVYAVTFFGRDDGIRGARSSAEFIVDREAIVRLHPTRVDGVVVSSDGRPVSNAEVNVEHVAGGPSSEPWSPGDVPVSTRVDANGAFVVRGLEPGSYAIFAESGARKSQRQRVDIGDGQTPILHLVLPDAAGLTLRVVDARGQGIGRLVGLVVAPPAELGGQAQTASAETGADGTAAVGIAYAPGTHVQVSLAGARYPVATFSALPDDEGEISATMGGGSGQVTLVIPGSRWSPVEEAEVRELVLVGDQGGALPLDWLTRSKIATQVVSTESTTIVIPNLSAGEWRLVEFADSRALGTYLSGGAALDPLRTFRLRSGGRILVDLGR
jgi:hypothetical protein